MAIAINDVFLLLLLLSSDCISTIHADILDNRSRSLRVSARQYEPYIYQNDKGAIDQGIEFHLLKTISENMKINLLFEIASLNVPPLDCVHPLMAAFHDEVGYRIADAKKQHNITPFVGKQRRRIQVAGTFRAIFSIYIFCRNADICAGGLFPILNHSLMSIPYLQDDLTWCVQKAKPLADCLKLFFIMTPECWLGIIFIYGYGSGALLYILIQFDRKYKYRNNRDWHYTTWLIALPACIGVSPRFRPFKGFLRLYYGFMLIIAMFFSQIVGVYILTYLKIQVFQQQIQTIDKLIDRNFRLTGSRNVFNAITDDRKYSNQNLESFFICEDINKCLEHLKLNENYDMAVGGSRKHILNSPEFSKSRIYCFNKSENIATFPVSLHYPNADFYLKAKIDKLIRQLSESGLFEKWDKDSQRRRPYDVPYTYPVEITIEEISAPAIFMLVVGSLMSIFAFISELIIYRQMQSPNHRKIWKYLEQFFDGQRHYLKNLPENLQGQGKKGKELNV